jgi:hypothetical protein
MEYTYELVENALGGKSLKRTDSDGNVWWIPQNEANSDYQRYLNPEAEHFTPNV